jgi:hypothetical protein
MVKDIGHPSKGLRNILSLNVSTIPYKGNGFFSNVYLSAGQH